MADNNVPDNNETDINRTIPYSSDDEISALDKTIAYADNPPGNIPKDKESIHSIKPGDTIVLKKKEYSITGVISKENQSGEAVVYKICDKKGTEFALKIYFQIGNPLDEPNREALKRILKIKDPDILPIFDFGTGTKKFLNKFCFEISTFASGGDLLAVEDNEFKRKYNQDFIEKKVIPQIFSGIKTLHKNKIFHGDLKPQNVFYLNKEQDNLVIGDYGSSKTYNQNSQKRLAYTFLTKGTSFYLAPEQARGIVSEKNDYYSFGMILLHLLYPEKVNQETLIKIIERQFAKKPIIDFDPKYKRINELIEGLTLQDIDKRWSAEEVEKWIKGEAIAVRYTDVEPVKLGDFSIYSEEDLLEYINTKKDWFENIIEDSQGYSLLLTWLSRIQDLRRKNIFDKMIICHYEDGKEFVKNAIIGYFRPIKSLKLNGKAFNFFADEDCVKLTGEFINELDKIWKKSNFKKISLHVCKLEFALRNLEFAAEGDYRRRVSLLLEKISSVLNINPKKNFSDYQTVFHKNLNNELLLELFYAFNPDRVFIDSEGKIIDTMEKAGVFFAKNKNLFNDRFYSVEKNHFLKRKGFANIINKSYRHFIFKTLDMHLNTTVNFMSASDITDTFHTNKPVQYEITFSIKKSLNDFFHDIDVDVNILRPERNKVKRKKSKKKNSNKQISDPLTDTRIKKIILDDNQGDDISILNDFWRELESIDSENPVQVNHSQAPSGITENVKSVFAAALLSEIERLRDNRKRAEEKWRKNQIKKNIKGMVVLPLSLLPILLSAVIFAGEFLGIFNVKLFLRSFYIFGSASPNLFYDDLWDILVVFLNWNMLYIFSVIPAAAAFFYFEQNPRIKKKLMSMYYPPIGFAIVITALGFVFGVAIPLVIFLPGLIENLFFLKVVVLFICFAAILRKSSFLFINFLNAVYGVNRRARTVDRSENRIKRFSMHRPIILADRLFPQMKSLVPAVIIFLVILRGLFLVIPSDEKINVDTFNKTIGINNSSISDIDYSPYGKLIASAGPDRIVRLWDGKTGKFVKNLRGNTSGILSVRFSPDAKYLVSSAYGKKVLIWNLFDLNKNRPKKYWVYKTVAAICFTPDADYFTGAGYSKYIRTWKASSRRRGRYIRKIHNANIVSIDFSYDRKYFASTDRYYRTRIWKVKYPSVVAGSSRGIKLKKYKVIKKGCTQIVFSPDSSNLAGACVDKKIRIWDASTGKILKTRDSHKAEITCIRYSPNGKYLLSCSRDGMIILWNNEKNSEEVAYSSSDSYVKSAAFHPSGNYFITANSDSSIRLIKTEAESR
ncbi:MAG: protein kinase [Spirochaetes bacterium]|nr:protein kinase [Spirochaetota bacterium]